MIKIFYTTIRDRYGAVLIYCGVVLGLIVMYVGLYPSLQSQSQQYAEIFKSFPDSFMKAFGFDSAQAFFFSLESFLSAEQYSLTWPILAAILSMSFAANNIAHEIENGTIEFILSLPVSRLKFYLGRYFAGLVLLAIFTASSVLSAIPVAKLYDVPCVWENYFKLSFGAFLFVAAIYSIATFFSAMMSEKSKTYAVSAGIVIGMYILNVISSLKDGLADLKYFSFFHYFSPAKLLVDGEIDIHSVWVFGLTIIFFIAAGAFIYSKRDIATT
jgi:ABC-2 type transport system permease protein